MSNNEQRDELADEIAGHPIGHGYYSTSVGIDEAREIADAILAASYRKPRTITTVEEVASLPTGAVLLSEQGGVWSAWDHLGWREPGSTAVVDDYEITLPATVIHEPTTEATL